MFTTQLSPKNQLFLFFLPLKHLFVSTTMHPEPLFHYAFTDM